MGSPRNRKPESSRLTLFLAASLCMAVFGVVLALPGTALGLADVRARLGIGLAQQGQMILLVFVGLAAATLGVGPLVDRFGTKRVLAASAFIVGAGLLMFAAARGAAAVAAAMLTLGIGGAGINTAANVLVSDIYPAGRGRMLNRLALGSSVGGLLLPLLAAVTFGRVPIRELTLLVAAIAMVASLWTASLRFAVAPAHTSINLASLWRVGRLPGLWLLGLLLLLESANESAMAGWTSTYGQALGLAPARATWVLAFHWMALTAGRGVLSGTVDRVGRRRVAIACAACAAAGAVTLVVAATPAGLVLSAVLLGVAFSLIFPTVLAIGGQRYPENAGTVFGCLLASAQVGGIVFPALIGAIAEATTVRTGMGVLVATTAALLLLIGPATRGPREMKKAEGTKAE